MISFRFSIIDNNSPTKMHWKTTSKNKKNEYCNPKYSIIIPVCQEKSQPNSLKNLK